MCASTASGSSLGPTSAGTTAALASANFRDGEEGSESNSTHVEGLEAINEDREANEGEHTEGKDKGIAEAGHNEDREEELEVNSTYSEGSEAMGKDKENSHTGDND